MRKITGVIFIFLFLCVSNYSGAQNTDFIHYDDSAEYHRDGFKVKDFHADVDISRDGYFDVTEYYDLDFVEEKHGLLRHIKQNYRMTGIKEVETKDWIDIDNIDVPGRTFETIKEYGGVTIKIGDKYNYVSGRQEYVIKYRVKYAFIYTDTATSFYWNFIGSDWNTVFEKASFSIHLPDNQPLSTNDYFVYTGEYGSKESIACITYDHSTVYGEIRKKLPEHDEVTVLINFPTRYIYHAAAWEIFASRYPWVIEFGVFTIAYVLIWLVFRKKRALEVVEFQPPAGVDPAMAGFLINGSVEVTDIVSLIPYWGAAGYITVTQINNAGHRTNDTVLCKLKDLPGNVPEYESVVFDALFESRDSVKISSLKYSFDTALTEAAGELERTAINARYYVKGQKYEKHLDLVIFIMAIVWYVGFYIWLGHNAAVIVLVSFAVICFLGKLNAKRRNEENDNEVMRQLKGFKMFIEKADKDRLEVLLKDDPGYFESTVGYAIAFGMLKEWTQKFDGLSIGTPAWYLGGEGYSFTPVVFAEHFGETAKNLYDVLVASVPTASHSSSSYTSYTGTRSYSSGGYSSSSSSHNSSSSSSSSRGSGHSGGGFGGGGGGSW